MLKLGLCLVFPKIYFESLGLLSGLFGIQANMLIHGPLMIFSFFLLLAETLATWRITQIKPQKVNLGHGCAILYFTLSSMILCSAGIAFVVMSTVAGLFHLFGSPFDVPSLLSFVVAMALCILFDGPWSFSRNWSMSLVGVIITAILIEGAAGVLVYLSVGTLVLHLFLSVIAGFWWWGYLGRAEESEGVGF